MKTTPDDRRIVERMGAGILCSDGFLGSDHRPLDDIIAQDTNTVESLGFTNQQIADSLRKIYEKIAAGMGKTVSIEDKIDGVFFEAMGRIPCPWADGVQRKGQAEITDHQTGKKILLTQLTFHMIEQHGFYQGKGSVYRLEPTDAIELIKKSNLE